MTEYNYIFKRILLCRCIAGVIDGISQGKKAVGNEKDALKIGIDIIKQMELSEEKAGVLITLEILLESTWCLNENDFKQAKNFFHGLGEAYDSKIKPGLYF